MPDWWVSLGEALMESELRPRSFTLTDAEREAIAWFSIYSDTPGEERHAVVLANLLERTK